MKHLKQRILSFLVCVVFCVSCLPAGAFGENEGTDPAGEAAVSSEAKNAEIPEGDGTADDGTEAGGTAAPDAPETESTAAQTPETPTQEGNGEENAAEASADSGEAQNENNAEENETEPAASDSEGGSDTGSSDQETGSTTAETDAGTGDTGVSGADADGTPGVGTTEVAGSDAVTQENGTAESAEAGNTTGTTETAARTATEADAKAAAEQKDDDMAQEINVTLDAITSESGTDNEDLLNRYAERALREAIPGRRALRAAKNVGGQLSEVNNYIYSTLYSCIQETAAGSRPSTQYTVNLSSLGLSCTASQLGLENFDSLSNKKLISLACSKCGIDMYAVINALLADCPYELYWYDKTIGMEPGYKAGKNTANTKVTLTSVTCAFTVVSDYSAGNYLVDSSYAESISSAISTAKGIVSGAASLEDRDKLETYCSEICARTSYNRAAANAGGYGNPWQMIWVFDGDSSTNVVCEGYAKAFQYLCDMTSFDYGPITCYTVTGDVTSYFSSAEEGHMWNTVTMEDGENYLIDVTNCDSGAIGAPDKLFLRGYDSGSVSGGYTVKCGGSSWVKYVYDEECRATFSTADLTLANHDHNHQHEEGEPVRENVVKATYQAAGSYDEVVYCTQCGRELSRTTKTVKKLSLATPEITSISSKAAKVTLKWNKVSGAQKYRVFRKTGSGSWQKIKDTTSLSFTDSSVKSGTKYTYTVRCINSTASYYMSAYDKTGKTITASFPLDTPVLTSVKNTVNGVRVKWNKVSGAEKYRVFRKTVGGKWQALGDTTGVSFTDKKAKIGVTYVYTVRCINSSGKTMQSDYDRAGKSIKAAYVLDAPVLKSVTSNDTVVTVKWAQVDGAAKYAVFRKLPGGKWKKIGTTTGVKFKDRTAKYGTEYTYTVRCISSDGKQYTSAYDKTGLSVVCK